MLFRSVERAIVVCGSARTSVYNQVFLRSLLATLEAAPEHIGKGRFSTTPTKALRAFARIYAGWAMSQDWYRANLHLTGAGAANLDDFLDNKWEPGSRAERRRIFMPRPPPGSLPTLAPTNSMRAISHTPCRRSEGACF